MFKKYVKEFVNEREPRPIRLRRSSRHLHKDQELALEYAVEEHLLYRGEELLYIYKRELIRKTLDEVMSSVCPLLCGIIGEELILPYALPSTECVSSVIVKC
jgi:hypothetical protein|tara:strand:- start:358 stop:663 length:306 start_codon:yes stop_codon:yes gene_type:complete